MGTVVVRELGCTAELPIGGAGRVGADFILANSKFRAIVRAAPTALTVLHTSGGTLLDAAPWSTGIDGLHEVFPLVGGGWLDLDTFEMLDDGVRLAGTVAPLPGDPPSELGARREVIWRIQPDESWLTAEGADGLDVHPTGRVSWSAESGLVQNLQVLYSVDEALSADLGGVLRFDLGRRLLVSDPVNAWPELAGATRAIGGTAPGASELRLFAGERLVGRVGLDALSDGTFHLEIPTEVTGIEARGFGLPSPRVAPTDTLSLQLGTPAALQVHLDWVGLDPREASLTSTTAAGLTAETPVPAGGGTLFLSPGQVAVAVGGVRDVERTEATAEVGTGGAALTLALYPAWDPGPRVPALLGTPTDGDRGTRSSVARTLADATADGFRFVTLAPTDAIPTASPEDDPGEIGFRTGVRSTHPEGWSIVSWPWTASDKFSGWGAPDLAHLDAREALQVATGATSRRFTVVDTAWLAVGGQPWEHRFLPDFVALTAPGPEGPAAAWPDWIRWLDQGAALVPTGPVTWVTVADPALVGATEVESALVAGAAVAGSGPVIDFTWAGTAPGEIVADVLLKPGLPGRLRLAGGGSIDRLALLGEGGALVEAWVVAGDTEIPFLHPKDPGGWVVAVGWTSTGGGDWATTGPIWITPPG